MQLPCHVISSVSLFKVWLHRHVYRVPRSSLTAACPVPRALFPICHGPSLSNIDSSFRINDLVWPGSGIVAYDRHGGESRRHLHWSLYYVSRHWTILPSSLGYWWWQMREVSIDGSAHEGYMRLALAGSSNLTFRACLTSKDVETWGQHILFVNKVYFSSSLLKEVVKCRTCEKNSKKTKKKTNPQIYNNTNKQKTLGN